MGLEQLLYVTSMDGSIFMGSMYHTCYSTPIRLVGARQLHRFRCHIASPLMTFQFSQCLLDSAGSLRIAGMGPCSSGPPRASVQGRAELGGQLYNSQEESGMVDPGTSIACNQWFQFDDQTIDRTRDPGSLYGGCLGCNGYGKMASLR